MLTTLGIIIGVAAVIAIVALGEGASASVSHQLAGLGVNVLTITPGSTSSGGARTGAGNATTLTADDATAISDSVHAIWSFFGQYGGTATFGEPISREFTLSGLPRQLLISRTLFPEGTSPVGSVIRIRNVSFTVVGVLPTCWIPPRQT